MLGHLGNGLGYYRFSYLGSNKAYVGVMAQEVQAQMPKAMTRGSDGYLRVYYEKLGLKFLTYREWLASGAQRERGYEHDDPRFDTLRPRLVITLGCGCHLVLTRIGSPGTTGVRNAG